MANISQINGFGIYADTASLAQSASSVLVDREGVNGPAYLTYVDSSNPSGDYERLYSSDSLYLSGSTLFSTRVNSSFTGSLLGTASYATQALSASYAPGGGGDGGTNLGLVYAVSLGYIMP